MLRSTEKPGQGPSLVTIMIDQDALAIPSREQFAPV